MLIVGFKVVYLNVDMLQSSLFWIKEKNEFK